MPVNAVSSVSFGRKNNNAKKADKNQYFKWVSQNQTNNALKMSVGREVENGKFQVASAATKLAGIAGMFASVLTLVNLRNKTYDLISNPTTKEMAFKKLSSFTKKSKIAKVGMIASAGALYTSFIINEVNRKKADKTANERGFLTERDSLKIKNAQENYFVNNHIYNEHIKG